MFLRKNRKRCGAEVYQYWTLCESVRTERGPRQRVVASLGKFTEEDLLAGWEDLEALLDGRTPAPQQADLFDKTQKAALAQVSYETAFLGLFLPKSGVFLL
jgi:hypothetical protein